MAKKKQGNFITRPVKKFIGDPLRKRAAEWSRGLDSTYGEVLESGADLGGAGKLFKFGASFVRAYGQAYYNEDHDFYNKVTKQAEGQHRHEMSLTLTLVTDDGSVSMWYDKDSILAEGKPVWFEGVTAKPTIQGLSEGFVPRKGKAKEDTSPFVFDRDSFRGDYNNSMLKRNNHFYEFNNTFKYYLDQCRSNYILDTDISYDNLHLNFQGPPLVYDKDEPDKINQTEYHFSGDSLKNLHEEIFSEYSSRVGFNQSHRFGVSFGYEDTLSGVLSYIEAKDKDYLKLSTKTLNPYDETLMESASSKIIASDNQTVAHFEQLQRQREADLAKKEAERPQAMFTEDTYNEVADKKRDRDRHQEDQRAERNEERYVELNDGSTIHIEQVLNEIEDVINLDDPETDTDLAL